MYSLPITIFITIVFFLQFSFVFLSVNKPPNIVIFLADDLGFNDVSFRGSNEIFTPNIDAIAYNGIILDQFYASSMCTPSRSALLTGMFPIHTGMHKSVILEAEPRGLPLNLKLLPEYLKEADYSTHLIGKWHLGFSHANYTPLRRGFDTHYGYYQGYQDYYTHNVQETFGPYEGYDMRRNEEVDWEASGVYTTDLLTREAKRIIENHADSDEPLFLMVSHLAPHSGTMDNPLQAPEEEIQKYLRVEDEKRRVYAAMVSKLDESIGQVMDSLSKNGLLDNSVIMFMSDNGAPTFGVHSNQGSNYPLRGIKSVELEGGVRVASAIWSPFLKEHGYVSSNIMSIADVLPTLCSAAGISVENLVGLDGINLWPLLTGKPKADVRVELPHNIEYIDGKYFGALRWTDWKYITLAPKHGVYSSWVGAMGNHWYYDTMKVTLSKSAQAILNTNPPLYNLNVRKIHEMRDRTRVNCKASLARNPNAEKCNPLRNACLINIRYDPCELINMRKVEPILFDKMRDKFNEYAKSVVEPLNRKRDEKANPELFGGVWTSWMMD